MSFFPCLAHFCGPCTQHLTLSWNTDTRACPHTVGRKRITVKKDKRTGQKSFLKADRSSKASSDREENVMPTSFSNYN